MFIALVLNSTAVYLNWSSPSLPYGVITSYTITYNTSQNEIQIIRIPGNKTTNYTVQGLNEDTAYTFTAYASTRIGAGPSTELDARTDEYCRLLSTVIKPHSQALHGSSFLSCSKTEPENLRISATVIIVSAVYCTRSKTGDLHYCQCFANSIDWQGILDISIFMQ